MSSPSPLHTFITHLLIAKTSFSLSPPAKTQTQHTALNHKESRETLHKTFTAIKVSLVSDKYGKSHEFSSAQHLYVYVY